MSKQSETDGPVPPHPRRSSAREARLVAVACAAVAVFASIFVAGAILTANNGNVGVLARIATSDPFAEKAREIDPDIGLTPPVVHYDGVYYFAIALDPFMRTDIPQYIDLAAHRYGHPAYGWAAALASFGRDEWIPHALLGLSVLGLAVGSYVSSRIAAEFNIGSPWMGLLVALNPGLLFAVAADTSEALSAGVLAVALLLWFKDKRILAMPFLVILCFFKFQLVLVPVGLGLWELIRALRARPIRIAWDSLVLLGLGPILFGLWQIYVHGRLGEWPTSLGPELLSIPPIGFLETIGLLGHINQLYSGDAQLVAAQLPIVVGIFGVFVVGLIRALRFRNAIDCIFVFQALMFLSLNHWNVYFPKELIRVAAIPAVLLVIVLAPSGVAKRLAGHPANAVS